MKETQILLTGASGAIGEEVIELLVKNPHAQLTVFDIQSKRLRQLAKDFLAG